MNLNKKERKKMLQFLIKNINLKEYIIITKII